MAMATFACPLSVIWARREGECLRPAERTAFRVLAAVVVVAGAAAAGRRHLPCQIGPLGEVCREMDRSVPKGGSKLHSTDRLTGRDDRYFPRVRTGPRSRRQEAGVILRGEEGAAVPQEYPYQPHLLLTTREDHRAV